MHYSKMNFCFCCCLFGSCFPWVLLSFSTLAVPLCIECIFCFLTGAMSFSAGRHKIEPKKPSKKIGNLFSDAWKKGNVIEQRVRLLLVPLFYQPINSRYVNYSAGTIVSDRLMSVRRKKFQTNPKFAFVKYCVATNRTGTSGNFC